MRTILLFIVLSCICCNNLEAINKEKFLLAISEVETNHNYKKIGDSGERSEFQLMERTWYQHTDIEFRIASMKIGRPTVYRVASSHLDWIIGYLKGKGYPVTAYNLAICWNAGSYAFHTNKIKERNRDYARRVSNLYGVEILLISK